METFDKYVLKGITEDRVREIINRIRPIFKDETSQTKLYVRTKDINPFTTAFLWDPKSDGLANSLKEVKRINSLHTFSMPLVFKPTLAECAVHLEPYMQDGVDAFEVLTPAIEDQPFVYLMKDGQISNKMGPVDEAMIAETLHNATIVLYTKTPGG
jgi:hypothetical protein